MSEHNNSDHTPTKADALNEGAVSGDTIIIKPEGKAGEALSGETSVIRATPDEAALAGETVVINGASERAKAADTAAEKPKQESAGDTTVFKKPDTDEKAEGADEEASEEKAEEEPEENKGLLKENKWPRPFLLSVLFDTLAFLALAVVLCGIAAFGLVMGVAKAYVDTTPALDLSQLTKSDRTSYIYDKDGELLTTFAGMEYRDWVDIKDIPDMLKNALISVEDVRFYKHGGVDLKRLFSAVVNTLRNTNTHGGSTLTQQLIKNKILSNERSYKRKIQEAYLAYELEHTISKDEILEAYMNDVFLGESNYGFAAAAKDYFGKTLDQLTIRECAMLAGMVQKPYYTNPRANTYSRFYEDGTNKMDVTNNRTDVVLAAMYDAGCITHEQYLSALNDTVTILEKSEKKQLYDMPYFIEYAISDVITHMLEQRGLENTKSNRTALENELRTGGYHIYLTVDPDIQHTVQDIITNWANYPELQNPSAAVQITTNSDGTTMEVLQPQAAAVIIDQSTGELRAVIGGRQEPTLKKQLNRAYQSSMPVGSAIKPLSVYGPALDGGLNCASSVLNAEIPIEGYGGAKGYPAIGSTRWYGMRTIRRGLTSSLNIVAARLLFDYVTPQVGASYLNKLGIPYSRINIDGPGLALGTSGITPIEMAAAYATIANGGYYLEPISFTVVLDDTGKVVLSAKEVQKNYRVYKETTAYMLIDMMKDVIATGTGTNAAIPGITVAGKTGTNDDYTSVYFAGMTGYYTGALWIGHDLYSEKLATGSTGGNSAAPLWQAFMSAIHQGLGDKPIMDVSPGEIGLAKVEICPISGKLATDACRHDTHNPPITDWCAVEDIPADYCDLHVCLDVCSSSSQVAGINCPVANRQSAYYVLIPPESVYALLEHDEFRSLFPNGIITGIPADEYYSYCLENGRVCQVHQSGTSANQTLNQLTSEANTLIYQVNQYLASVQTLSDTDRNTLTGLIQQLYRAIDNADLNAIASYIEQLRYNYEIIRAANPIPVTPDPEPEPQPSP